jgi:hypothetical protein
MNTAEIAAMFKAAAVKFAGLDDITERARIGAAQMRKRAEGDYCPERQSTLFERNVREMHAAINACTVSTRTEPA